MNRQSSSFGVQTVPFRTTRIERLLLIGVVALLPIENHIPPIMGLSITALVFGVIAIYVLLNRAPMLGKVWTHPLFLTAYGFLLVIAVLELTHPYSDYWEILRIVQMVFGGVVVAALCRDQGGLRAGLYGWLVAGLGVACYLIGTGYSNLADLTAGDFHEATAVRANAFEGGGLTANLNALAFFAAQGAAVALALGVTERTAWRKALFLGVMLTCVVGVFIVMSRGGIIILAASCLAIMGCYGLMKARIIVVVALLAIVIALFVPEVVFSRLVYKATSHEGEVDARTQVYTAVLDNLPEYFLVGVGAGHFWKSWGGKHGFAYQSSEGSIIGSHNCFAQVTIYWGLGGLCGVLAVIWQAYRYFPRACRTHSLKLCLLGTTVSLLPWMATMHNIYNKEYSLGLGLIVGASLWIWPRSVGGVRFQPQENVSSAAPSKL